MTGGVRLGVMQEAAGQDLKLGVAAIHSLGPVGGSSKGGGMLPVVRDFCHMAWKGEVSKQRCSL